jgi:hypothetical protein
MELLGWRGLNFSRDLNNCDFFSNHWATECLEKLFFGIRFEIMGAIMSFRESVTVAEVFSTTTRIRC